MDRDHGYRFRLSTNSTKYICIPEIAGFWRHVLLSSFVQRFESVVWLSNQVRFSQHQLLRVYYLFANLTHFFRSAGRGIATDSTRLDNASGLRGCESCGQRSDRAGDAASQKVWLANLGVREREKGNRNHLRQGTSGFFIVVAFEDPWRLWYVDRRRRWVRIHSRRRTHAYARYGIYLSC